MMKNAHYLNGSTSTLIVKAVFWMQPLAYFDAFAREHILA
jgi:hypothetical protein